MNKPPKEIAEGIVGKSNCDTALCNEGGYDFCSICDRTMCEITQALEAQQEKHEGEVGELRSVVVARQKEWIVSECDQHKKCVESCNDCYDRSVDTAFYSGMSFALKAFDEMRKKQLKNE